MTDLPLDRYAQEDWDRLAARQARQQRIVQIVLYVTLTVLVIAYSMPSIGVLITSFKSNAEISRAGVWSAPTQLNFANYEEAWVNGNVRTYALNSFLVTIPATALSIGLGVLLGYVFSQMPFRGSEALFIVIVAGMFFPPQIVLVPLFRLFNTIGLYEHPVADDHRPRGVWPADLHP
jgi:ABC-type glycerol-3-phosphate transport system permease component